MRFLKKNDFNKIDILIRDIRINKAKSLIKTLFNKNTFRLLDIGCGSDYFLVNKFGGWGLDPKSNNLDQKNIHIKRGVAKDILPKFENNFFDIITLLAVIEHLEFRELELLLEQSGRILKKNAFLLITTPKPLSKSILKLSAKLFLISREEITGHKLYYSPKNLIQILEKYNFKIIKQKSFELGLNCLYLFQNKK
ncbi:MAG: methyltransferase domain-containing protein [Candidatus Paceibacterota bacterium]|jgi:ubiquinone/menaquinone biosynthesis C-methylase UbiE